MHSNYIEVGILLYPQAQLSAVLGLADLFSVANRYLSQHTNTEYHQIRISHWQINKGRCCRVYDSEPQATHQALAVVIVPPSLAGLPNIEDLQPYGDFLLEHHRQGAIMASVCIGAYILAQVGLLDGRQATTHWNYTAEFQQRFAKVKWNTDKLLVDNGDIITAGGVMAWTDLGLKLLDKLAGSSCMLSVARTLLLDPPGREQRLYSLFSPNLQHGDQAILTVQHWLQEHANTSFTVEHLADKAGLQLRTFQRRFIKACGINPLAYCQQLRVSKACELIQYSRLPIDNIAWQVGYQDSGAFRKIFHRVKGVSPAEYRRRFVANDQPSLYLFNDEERDGVAAIN
ncbi:GlxA family transcriptional regulator [Agarivorans sp.]|uniref:GlxA family transcriptional regulator n=1 Tax=Agarivorans sp. TaxID=1872412 RepID=UPI003CFEB09C